jgi:hypothetical protein
MTPQNIILLVIKTATVDTVTDRTDSASTAISPDQLPDARQYASAAEMKNAYGVAHQLEIHLNNEGAIA